MHGSNNNIGSRHNSEDSSYTKDVGQPRQEHAKHEARHKKRDRQIREDKNEEARADALMHLVRHLYFG